MSCLPPSAKCEWRDLKYFVAHWNAQRHSAFERTACLDLCSQTKQPEVLCTDTQTGSKLVIERKSLLWPQNYAEIHHAEHRFWEFLTTAINRLNLPECPYSLHVEATNEVRDGELRRLANDISSAIDVDRHLLLTENIVTRPEPLRFTFRLESPGERDSDAPPYGLAICSDEPQFDELGAPELVPAPFKLLVERLFQSTAGKFSNYTDCEKVLILNFSSPNLYIHLDGNWWSRYFEMNPPQPSIDEVWASFEYEPSRWSFTQLHPQPVKSHL